MRSPVLSRILSKVRDSGSMLDLHKKTVEGKLYVFRVVFPTKRDSATFWDKGTTEQAQKLAKRWGGLGQPVKIREGTIPDFDSLSLPVPREKMEKSRRGLPKKGIGLFKTGKDGLKQENDALKLEIWSIFF